MFVLILTYKAPVEKVIELLEAHCCYLDKYYAAGIFLASGRRCRTGELFFAVLRAVQK